MQSIIVCFLLMFSVVSFGAYYPPVVSKTGIVVSDQYLASKVGARILRQGGNAMDAAVAVGYALAVVDPCCGNIGGGGFMLIHWHDGQNIVLNFRETAPAKINAKLFFNAKGERIEHKKLGYLLVGVPGTVLGLSAALKKFGTMTRQQVMKPAIKLAKKGFVLNRFDEAVIVRGKKAFVRQPNIRKIFMPKGVILQAGQRLVQKNLAHTLSLISKNGADVFYKGSIAKAVVAASALHHGVLTMEDFKNYKVVWADPINCSYRGFPIITVPPPSSGVTICETLKIIEAFPLMKNAFHAANAVRYNAAAMSQAFYDRNKYLGDPAFIKNPITQLLSEDRIKAIQTKIENGQLFNPIEPLIPDQSLETTHFVVMDKVGNVVSTTYTINSLFGSKLMAANTGFFLNNELDDFTLKVGHANQFKLVQGNANLIRPNKRPLSSMSPTIVMHNNKVFMATGAAGGPTIITTIVQSIENAIDYGMDIRAAVNAPRYHMQWRPNIIYMEPFSLSLDTIAILEKIGYQLQNKLFGRFKYWGAENAIMVNKANELTGSSDNRRPNGRAVAEDSSHKSPAKKTMF